MTNTDLSAVDATSIDYLFGAFGPSHLPYDYERDPEFDPSVTDMTLKALEVLRKNENGFFLMVEDGHIDKAHHGTKANKALSETVALDTALEALMDELSPEELEETLIIVTADHSHVMSMAGNQRRGKDIRGIF